MLTEGVNPSGVLQRAAIHVALAYHGALTRPALEICSLCALLISA